MGLALLLLLYSASACAFPLLARLAGRRPSFASIAVLSLLPLAFTWQGFLPERTLSPTRLLAGVSPWADEELVRSIDEHSSERNPVLLDPVSQMMPWQRAAREGLLFNPYQGSGAALLGNGQSAVLFPTEVVSRLLAPFRAVTYSQVARLLLAAWGMYLLARTAGFTELAALTSSFVFTGSGFLQLWRLHPHSLAAAMAPWILAAAVGFYRHPAARTAVVLAVVGAIAFAAGHPETLLHVMLFAAVTVPAVSRLAEPPLRRPVHTDPHMRTPVAKQGFFRDVETQHFGQKSAPSMAIRWEPLFGWGTVAGVLALLLSAPLLLPFVEALRVSTEWTVERPKGRTNVETSLVSALDRLRPAGALYALGDPVSSTWRGPENLAELGGAATGGGALYLTFCALAAGRIRRTLPILLVGVAGLMVGANMPVVSVPFAWIPLLGDSLLKRLSLWWVLAAALLAAEGLDALRDGLSRRRKRSLIVAALAVGAGALTIALASNSAPSEELGGILRWEIGAVVGAALAMPMVALGARRIHRLLGASLLLIALTVPRAALFAGWVPVVPPQSFYVGTPAVEVVTNRLRALDAKGFRVAGIGPSLTPNSAAFFELEDVRTYDPMTFAPYDRFLSALGESSRPGWVRIVDPGAPALAFLGVRFVFDQPAENDRPKVERDAFREVAGRHFLGPRHGALLSRGIPMVHAGGDAVVWERTEALPRAFFPAAYKVIADPAAAVAFAIQVPDFAELAVVDQMPVGVKQTGKLDHRNPAAHIHQLAVGRGHIDAEVESESSAILATSQPAIPGWRLTVDDRPFPSLVRRVNGAFLGVAVPPGRHRIRLRFAPSSWAVGLFLGGGGLAVAAVLLIGEKRGTKGRPLTS